MPQTPPPPIVPTTNALRRAWWLGLGQELIDHAQRIVPRELTAEERKRFFLSAE